MIYEEKDITTVEKGVVAHGVNCMHAMGSGVALAIKTKWPEIYEAYMSISVEDQRDMLGGTQIVPIIENELYVANCFTQYTCGGQPADGSRYKYANEQAIYTSLKKAFGLAKSLDIPLYLPKLGAGLGGLLWDEEVVPEIEKLERMHKMEAIVCVYIP